MYNRLAALSTLSMLLLKGRSYCQRSFLTAEKSTIWNALQSERYKRCTHRAKTPFFEVDRYTGRTWVKKITSIGQHEAVYYLLQGSCVGDKGRYRKVLTTKRSSEELGDTCAVDDVLLMCAKT